ncbi:MAG: response regulator transcription factor, partial [Mesorhizobium sp.]
ELTTREREILTLVAAGLSNKRIGLRLNLHEKTIKHHMTRILAKLNVSNRTEAAMTLRDATERRHPPVRDHA